MTNNLDDSSSSIDNEFLHELILDISCDSNEPNEKLVMIINKNSGLAPYSHEFSKGNLDPQVISGFISAMTSFMGKGARVAFGIAEAFELRHLDVIRADGVVGFVAASGCIIGDIPCV